MHRHELALQMGRQLRDVEPVAAGDALDLVAIGVRFGRLLQVEEAGIPGRDLNALVAEGRGPAADGVERVERSLVAGELGEEETGTLHGFHGQTPRDVTMEDKGKQPSGSGGLPLSSPFPAGKGEGRESVRTASSGSRSSWHCPS